MGKKIAFKTSKVTIVGELNNSKTAAMIYGKLPLEARASTWGDEIYFEIPVHCPPERAVTDVSVGDIAFWPEGDCLCVFFGKTPASIDEKPKPASAVTLIGRITGDTAVLKNIRSGDTITVAAVDNR